MWKTALNFAATFAIAAVGQSALAQNHGPLTDAEILKKISYPPEFAATVFASPPNISYPIFISATPDGKVFVGCDENGSLDREPGRGRVVCCEDTNGDGKADKFTTFAKMDSPRGVAWDQSTRTLYVMHPPALTAYHDDYNTGVANRHEDLITGLGFDLNFRGADHTINGIRLGIDGWIYIACGDYGAVKATGRDGRSFEMRGGGIVRIRPDGSGMEFVVRGTRNILAVAISPTLELFTRDNTNDGDDWNDRLSFNPFGAQMGYPSLFRNFADEIIPTMIDFGGGAPVGSIFIDEPVLPAKWAYGFYSVEWGRNEIDLHGLKQKGATWTADTTQFMKIPRGTDLDVDGEGHLYAVSWDGATFNYAGPNVGYIIRLAAKGAKPAPAPDFKKLSEKELLANIGSGSAVWRLAAQRELLVRGDNSRVKDGLAKIIATNSNIGPRVAAIFTLKLLEGVKAHSALKRFLKDDHLREYIIKAIGDDPRVAAKISDRPLIEALRDKNPRVRLQAVTALGHLGKIDAAPELLLRTADTDYTVAHIAVQWLRSLKASSACLRVLDSSDASLYPGALRVLQALYDPAVVDGLMNRLKSAGPELREKIYRTLMRLDLQEAHYTDPKMWWGTRPDTSGPIFKGERWSESDRIETVLKQRLEATQGDEAKIFVTALLRAKIIVPGLSDLMLEKAGSDDGSRLEVIAPLLSPKTPAPENILKVLAGIATSTNEPLQLRVRAFKMLGAIADKNFPAVCDVYLSLSTSEQPEPLRTVWEEFTHDASISRQTRQLEGLASDRDPAKRNLGATILVNIVTSTVITDKKAKPAAQLAIERLWKEPDSAISLLDAIKRTRAAEFKSAVATELHDSNAAVAAAAKTTLASLGGASSAKLIGEMQYDEVVKIALATPGDAKEGMKLFSQQGCVVCHTISPKESPKGPMLGGIAARYSRAELCESILKPSAKIAQGFETQYFKLKNGEDLEGFVVKESGDSVEVRNIAGTSTTLEKGDILQRQRREKSIMPEGVVANISPEQLAGLLAYLESTSGK